MTTRNNEAVLQAIEGLRGDLTRFLAENQKQQEELRQHFFRCTTRIQTLRPTWLKRVQQSPGNRRTSNG